MQRVNVPEQSSKSMSIFWKDDNFLNHDLPVFRVAPAEAKN